MNICKICGKDAESVFKLSKHVTNTHKIKIKDYYDRYFACEESGKCIYCGEQTFFHGLVEGYSQSCKKCKPQAAISMRDRLKNDRDRFAEFRSKVSNNQRRIWEDRRCDKSAEEIHAKVGKSIRATNSKLSKSQLQERYGWQNRLTPDELDRWKNEVMLKTGCHTWWQNATDEQKSEVVNRRISTIIQTEITLVEQCMLDKNNQGKYYQAVSYITEMNYHRYKYIIDPNSQRGNGYHLDHRFSIKAGFVHKVSPAIIGHYRNLELLPADQNMRKNAKCSITLNELMEIADV
jgi:hypothetical protein